MSTNSKRRTNPNILSLYRMISASFILLLPLGGCERVLVICTSWISTCLLVLFAWSLIVPFFYLMNLWRTLPVPECLKINLMSLNPLLNARKLNWVTREKRLK